MVPCESTPNIGDAFLFGAKGGKKYEKYKRR